jgi:hypothetical protein
MRDKAQVTRLFDGLEPAGPGIVSPQLWRPAGPVPADNVTAWCGVAWKP